VSKGFGVRHLIGVAIIFLCGVSLLAGIYLTPEPNGHAPKVWNGEINLTGWHFEKDGIIPLNGEWEFYPNRMLESSNFVRGEAPEPTYIQVPGTWRGIGHGKEINRKGAGTYRMVVTLPSEELDLAVRVPSVRMSHRLFVNGKLEGMIGVPGLNKSETSPGNTPYIAYFHSQLKTLEIIVQVSNFDFVTGGIVNPISLGLSDDIADFTMRRLGIDIGIILMLGVFAAYQFSLFVLGRWDRAYLYSGIFMLFLGLAYSLYNEKSAQRLMPDAPFELMYKLMDIGQFASHMFFFGFITTMNDRLLPRKVMHGLLAPIYMYLILICFLPYEIYSEIKYILVIYLSMTTLVLIVRMLYLIFIVNHQRENRSELLLLFGGGGLVIYIRDEFVSLR
jgi:two-component system sensor histidine kinase ChiS